MFSYGPPGLVDERALARTTAEMGVDVIHLQFAPGREAEGPVNIYLCEDRNGTISIWPTCDLWTDRGSFFLVVPRGKGFGFAFHGSALIRVTDVQSGQTFDENARHARELPGSAAAKVPSEDTA